jgi:hypothetical protein
MALSIVRFLSRYDTKRVALELFNEPPPPCNWRDRPRPARISKEALLSRSRCCAGPHIISHWKVARSEFEIFVFA